MSDDHDLMNDATLIRGVAVLVWLCVAGLGITAWVMFA